MPQWEICEDGVYTDTIEADTLEEALEDAKADCDRDNYEESGKTIFVRISASKVVEEPEEGDITVTLEPEEPECPEDGHDWQRPQAIVGGIEENPGVQCNGGGVVITEVCMLCGCSKVTDTWAQDPETGEQGLTSVEYEPGEFSEEIEEMKNDAVGEDSDHVIRPSWDDTDPLKAEQVIAIHRDLGADVTHAFHAALRAAGLGLDSCDGDAPGYDYYVAVARDYDDGNGDSVFA